MADEEEVVMEVEAAQAVYEDDCMVIDSFPPHLHIHIKPRTADVSSQQFVEAIIRIRAGPQYPKEPPCIDIVDSKGLDDKRQKHLIATIQNKAHELSSCLMLVALCEEAVEELSAMNHPDGDCPLCLYPLVSEDKQKKILPFMKLMSCFHCFHSECIVRWWNWLQSEKESKTGDTSSATVVRNRHMQNKEDMQGIMKDSVGNCPVCRKIFHSKDIEHVLDLVGSQSSNNQNTDGIGDNDEEEVLKCDLEKMRRQKHEAILKLQQDNSGLIEPKKTLAVQPGMFLPQPVAASSATTPSQDSTEERRDSPVATGTNSSSSSNRSSSSEHRNRGVRRHNRGYNPRRQPKQWVRRANDTAE